MNTQALPLAIVVIALLGCGKLRQKVEERAAEKATEVMIEQTTGAEVDARDGGFTVRGPDGQTVTLGGSSTKVPAEFPKDVPVYPGATIDSSMVMGPTATVVTGTADDIPKVKAFYLGALKGYTKTAEAEVEGMSTLVYSGGGKQVTVALTRQGARTIATLVVAPATP